MTPQERVDALEKALANEPPYTIGDSYLSRSWTRGDADWLIAVAKSAVEGKPEGEGA